MEILRHVVVLIHLVGFAILFGAWVVEVANRRHRVTPLMNIGLAIAAVAGLILAAPWAHLVRAQLHQARHQVRDPDPIGALLGIGAGRQRKTGSVPPAIFWSIGILTLLNAGIAVIWR